MYSLHESEYVTIKYERNILSQIRLEQDMSAQGALRADLAHHDSMDGSTVHRRDYTWQSRRPSALSPEVHAPIGCPPAIRTNTYRSTIVLVTSCSIIIPRRIPRINPAAAAQLSWPSTRWAPSACFPRRAGGPQSVVPCPTHPKSIADTPARAAHGWVEA